MIVRKLHKFIAAALLATLWTAHAAVSAPCDHVVSYFLFPYQNSKLKSTEWRIFDPSRSRDILFLSSPDGFGDARWDTTFESVYFSTGDSLLRVPWRIGAKPRLVTKLPPRCARWWFNADSGRWQGLCALQQPKTDDPDYERYGGELWQSSRDGATWRRVRVDSLDLVDPDAARWQWADGSPVGTQAHFVTLDDLASETWEETWGQKTAFIDTSTLAVTKNDGNGDDSDQWFFLGLQSAPRRGIAFQLSGPLAPEHEWSGVVGPFYLVELDRRTKTPVAGSDAGLMRSLFAEHCGLLLVPGCTGNPRLLDPSGRVVFSQSWNSEGAVCVPAPRGP